MAKAKPPPKPEHVTWSWPLYKINAMKKEVLLLASAKRGAELRYANMEALGGCWALAFVDAEWAVVSHDFDKRARIVSIADRICEAFVRLHVTRCWNEAYAREGGGVSRKRCCKCVVCDTSPVSRVSGR